MSEVSQYRLILQSNFEVCESRHNLADLVTQSQICASWSHVVKSASSLSFIQHMLRLCALES